MTLPGNTVVTTDTSIKVIKQEERIRTIERMAKAIKELGMKSLWYCHDIAREFCDGNCDRCKRNFEMDVNKLADKLKGGEE